MTQNVTEEMASQAARDCIDMLLGVDDLGLTQQDIKNINRETGGRFSLLLRIETTQGPFFFKQYLDDSSATPAVERATLAFEVQREAAEVNEGTDRAIPRILAFDRDRSAFIMEEANGTTPLIDFVSVGTIPEPATTQLPRAIGRLHQATWGKYPVDSIYANSEARDSTLQAQYDDIAALLPEREANIVLHTKASYQQRAACVTHGDLSSRNVLVDDRSLGLFDFEHSHLGAPAYDLAYISSEFVIAKVNFGNRPEHLDAIEGFFDEYFSVFTAEDRTATEIETTNHLATQMIYRILGSSPHSRTFYLDDASKERIVEVAKGILSEDPAPVSQVVAKLGQDI